MDEYPEYDFYNSREKCDGKGRWERRGEAWWGDGREDAKMGRKNELDRVGKAEHSKRRKEDRKAAVEEKRKTYSQKKGKKVKKES